MPATATAILSYHPQNIQRLISKFTNFECARTIAQPDKSIEWRDELARNVDLLHNATATLELCPSKWLDYKRRDSNMVALLNSLDKMITIFDRKKIPYFSDDGYSDAGARVNYKERLVTITKNFINAALKKGHEYLPLAVKDFLQDKGTGILQNKANRQGTVIKNKAKILDLLHLAT